MLNECESEEVLERMRRHPAYKDMDRVITEAASYVHTIAATNPRRIDRGVTATRIDALLADVHFVGTLVR